jgi:hypothetical protein
MGQMQTMSRDFLVLCCDIRYEFRIKQCLVRLCSHFFCREFMLYLCYLCLFINFRAQNDFHIRWCSCCLTVTFHIRWCSCCLTVTRMPLMKKGLLNLTVHPRFKWGSGFSIFSCLWKALWQPRASIERAPPMRWEKIIHKWIVYG